MIHFCPWGLIIWNEQSSQKIANVWTEIKLCQMDTQMQLNILWIWATENMKKGH